MSQADKEYLLQLEDRQAVINTLESKLKYCDEEMTEGDDQYSMGAFNEEYYYDDEVAEDQDRHLLGLVHDNRFKM